MPERWTTRSSESRTSVAPSGDARKTGVRARIRDAVVRSHVHVPGGNMAVVGRIHGRLVWPGCDLLAWLVGMQLSLAARYDWRPAAGAVLGALVVALFAGGVQYLLGSASYLYLRRHPLGSAQEAVLLGGVVLSTGALVSAVVVVSGVPVVPRSVPAMAAVATLVLAGGLRLAVRARRDAGSRPDPDSALRVLVYGAGHTGAQLVRSMMGDTEGGLRATALLDDDPALRRQRVCGVPVLGSGFDVAEVARRTGAELLVIAIRNPDVELIRRVRRVAAEVGIQVKVLSPLGERLKPVIGIADLREIDINELLGRRPVETDVSVVSPYLTGRRVLVTGAGGSIGSELCRQIARFDPAELLMLDRDESALHALQLSIYGRALLDSPDVILADIRDAATIDRLFAARRPEIVFHAAALKHLPMLEQYPDEAWKSNVLGTVNVLRTSVASGVQRFVNISTDKAADPTSVLGQSKRIGERLVASTAAESGLPYLSVRFGNVLGSRGSVVTTFVEQLAAGAPVTVTHPEVRRYFMTVQEAVQLVLQAGALGRPGQVHVLDMGQQVRIVELARRLMATVGTDVPVVYTGLRKGEKLYEDLFGGGEGEDRRERCHPSITAVPVPALAAEVAALAGAHQGAATALAGLCVGDGAAGEDEVSEPTVPSARVGAPALFAPVHVAPRSIMAKP
ncbi:polysaccharide biosynthesis protein [Actinomycetospora sp. CA-084318]|uniref:polysaccharide biosynthesis protein n=1 Tax=Actinomycetospora sp. CA-084318 TaxID=3239892 RepID=UPI003D97BAF7